MAFIFGLCFNNHMGKIIIKNERQIEGIRRSSRLAAACLRFIEPYVAPGVTTAELDWRIEEFMRTHGAIPACLGYVVGENPPFPKATCISVNEVICHGIPDQYVLKNGDILNIDVTTILDDYFGDTSMMYSVGEISEDAKHILKVAKHCLDLGIKRVRPGAKFGEIGTAIQHYAWLMDCTVVYQFTGHGVGLRFHEPPTVEFCEAENSSSAKEIMQPGMIFTIEPMINRGVPDAVICEQDKWTARTADGKLSAQYEHTVLVTADGVEILTKV